MPSTDTGIESLEKQQRNDADNQDGSIPHKSLLITLPVEILKIILNYHYTTWGANIVPTKQVTPLEGRLYSISGVLSPPPVNLLLACRHLYEQAKPIRDDSFNGVMFIARRTRGGPFHSTSALKQHLLGRVHTIILDHTMLPPNLSWRDFVALKRVKYIFNWGNNPSGRSWTTNKNEAQLLEGSLDEIMHFRCNGLRDSVYRFHVPDLAEAGVETTLSLETPIERAVISFRDGAPKFLITKMRIFTENAEILERRIVSEDPRARRLRHVQPRFDPTEWPNKNLSLAEAFLGE